MFKNKKFIYIFILFAFLLTIIFFVFKTNLFENVLNNNIKNGNDFINENNSFTGKTVDTTSTGNLVKNKISIEELYNEIILENNLAEKINKDDFYYIFSLTNNIKEKNEEYKLYIGKKYFVYPFSKEDIIAFFKKYYNNYDLISNYNTNDKVILSKLNKDYGIEGRNYVFNNKSKNYFFSLDKFYEMNGVCSLIFGKQEYFYDFENGKVKIEYKYNDDFDLLKKGIEMHGTGKIMSEDDYNNFIKGETKDPIIAEKILYTIANNYIKTKDKKYIDLFNEKFYFYINDDYGYEEYSLFLEFKKIDGLNESYCDAFNKEFFIWK